jgi:hypothetical protein
LIMNELSKNADAYLYSTYCYKDREDRDNRVKFGPLWDYDLAFGNTHFQNGHKTEGWQWDEPTNYRLGIKRLLQDTKLVKLLQDRWNSLRDNILSDGALNEFIDTLVKSVNGPLIRNYEVWPVIDKNPWVYNNTYLVSNYNQEIDYLKDWLFKRTAWMDKNISNIFYPLKIFASTDTVKLFCQAFPNPFSDHLMLQLDSQENVDIRVEISNILGQVYFSDNMGTYQGHQEIYIDDQQISAMPNGIYVLRVFSDNSLVITTKIVKNKP